MSYNKTIDQVSDEFLISIIRDAQDISWNLLALKVMFTRLKLKLTMMDNETTRQQCCNDLRDLFRKSGNIPNAQKDMQLIVERYG
jgi:hypothetical protein